MKIYYNPNCSKSIAALEVLEHYSLNFEGVKYLTDGISSAEVLEISKILNLKVHDFVRTKEDLYKAFDVNWDNDTEAAEAIEKSPVLLERPIIIDGDRGVIARPTQLLEDFLNN